MMNLFYLTVIDRSAPQNLCPITACTIGTMDENKIEQILREKGITAEIRCPEVFQIAEEHGISRADLGAYCTEHGVKIRGCQLGCF